LGTNFGTTLVRDPRRRRGRDFDAAGVTCLAARALGRVRPLCFLDLPAELVQAPVDGVVLGVGGTHRFIPE
jgi:hypothetical protein